MALPNSSAPPPQPLNLQVLSRDVVSTRSVPLGLSGETNVSLGAPDEVLVPGLGIEVIQPLRDAFNETMLADETDTPYPDVLGPNYHRHIRMGILAVMFLLAVAGNSRVMFVLRRKWSSRGRMTVMSFNVALADTLVALITILGQLMWEILEKHWYLGNGACKVYKVASTFAITSSNYMLVAMAIDRHEAVVRPLNPFISAKNLALAAWAVSLVPSLPNLFIFAKAETPDGVFCVSKFYTEDLDKHFRQVYLLLVLVLVFISCEVLLPVFYFRIYFTLWKQNSYFKGGQRCPNDSRRSNSLLPKAKTKTLKMSFVIVVTFFITNTPYVIQELVLAFGQNLDPSVIAIFGIISASNSALNPFIYLLFCPKNESRSSESYRVTFKTRFALNGRSDTQHTPASAQDSLLSASKGAR